MMTSYCLENLTDLEKLVLQLSTEEFTRRSKLLSEASIGQHTRHILEFYLCLLTGVGRGVVNYDERNRDLLLENDRNHVINTIQNIKEKIIFLEFDQPITLNGCFHKINDHVCSIPSSIHRELAYCLEHSIHHMAMIKVGLMEAGNTWQADPDFGYAPSTLKYQDTHVHRDVLSEQE